MDSVDTVSRNGVNGETQSVQGRGLVAIPVPGGSSGEGLPYAPENWPNPGDKWRWKVGNRKSAGGYWIDRTLYLPRSCPRYVNSRPGFQSKVSVGQYIRKEYPNVDVNAFFSSFIWKVPCSDDASQKGADKSFSNYAPSISLGFIDSVMSEAVVPAPAPGGCKAGNMLCSSLTESNADHLTPNDCDICCSEVGFCRDCCCILCSRVIETMLGGYSFIRCEATVNESFICGHRVHLECALRCYMAGTVGGSIGLDVEYYCRRCDCKTDLMPHVTKLLKVCETIDSRDDAEKVLKLSLCILRGSGRIRAKSLCIRIGLAIAKLKRGVHLDEIWKVEADSATIMVSDAGAVNHNGNGIIVPESLDFATKPFEFECLEKVEPLQQIVPAFGDNWGFITMNHGDLAAKLDAKINHVLQELKRSQLIEYQKAEEKLNAQKDILLNLYQQLDYKRSELASPVTSTGSQNDALLSSYLKRVEQIKYEEEKLAKMMKIAYGFHRIPRSILAEYFGLTFEN